METPNRTSNPPGARDRPLAPLRLASIASLIAFSTAFLITAMTHEGAHAVVARLLGLHPILHHNYVQTPPNAPPDARLWVPAAGPIVSLVIGVACLTWVRAATRPSQITLTGLWLGIFGITTFCGYLVLGPISVDGDTGKVFAQLETPAILQWLAAGVGFVAMVLVIRGAAPSFARHAPQSTGPNPPSRRKIANSLIAIPAVAGTVVAGLLSLPAPTFVSLLFPLTIGLVSFAAYGAFVRSSSPLPGGVEYRTRSLFGPIALLAALVVVSLALIPGWRL